MADDFIDPIFEPSHRPSDKPAPEAPAPESDAREVPVDRSTPSAQPAPRKPTDDLGESPPVVAAQKPTEHVEPRVAARSTTQRQPQPDDIICSNCSHSNARDRTFCERCGTTLTATPIAPPPPPLDLTWWQRFTRWLRRLGRSGGRGQARSAGRGARIAYRRTLSIKNQVMRVLGLVGLVGGGLFAANVGPFGQMRTSILNRVTATTVEVRPESVTVLPAENETTLWPAREVSDGKDNTAWGVTWGQAATPTPCGADSLAEGRLRVTFPRSSLERIDLMLGLPGTNFENTARPSRIGLVLSSSAQCRIVDLEDTHDEQSIAIDGEDAESIEVWILSVIDAEADNPGLVLISELEIFAKE